MSNLKTNYRFYIILLVLLAVCGAVFFTVSILHYGETEPAADGVLDLTKADFTKEVYSLNGEWEFYHRQLLSPDDFASGQPQGKTYIHAPSAWNKKGYPLYGYATYRLTLLTNEKELMVFIPEIADASVIYINGEKVFEAGTVAVNAENHSPGFRNGFVRFTPDDNGNAEIIVQVSNFGWYNAGLRYSLQIGHERAVITGIVVQRIVLTAFLGMLIAMAFYHMMLFAYRSKEKIYIMFAVYCFVVAARFFVEYNGLAQILFTDGLGTVSSKIMITTTVMQSFLLVMFTHTAFNIPLKEKWRITVYAASFAVPLVHIFTPYGMVNVQISYTVMIPFVISFINAVKKPQVRKDPYNLMYLCVIALMNVWYVVQKIFFDDFMFMPALAPNIFMVLTQCLVLSVSYAEAKSREEELTRETNFYRRMAHDLRTPLTVVSTNIQNIDIAPPGEAEKMLNRAQSEIMKMADKISDALYDGDVEK